MELTLYRIAHTVTFHVTDEDGEEITDAVMMYPQAWIRKTRGITLVNSS